MRLPRDLSGDALVKALCRKWGYHRVHQRGSHVVLQTSDPSPHRVAVPVHRALRVGTLHSIIRSVARQKGVDVAEVLASL